jgi:putative heme-binding domain-containing protein
MREPGKLDRPKDPRRAIASPERELRENAAQQLLKQGEAGRAFLHEQLGHKDPRVRAAALTALIDADDRKIDLDVIAEKDPLAPMRALAVRALVTRGGDATRFLDAKYPPALRLDAVASLKDRAARPRLLRLLADSDPFLRHAAIQQLARVPSLLANLDPRAVTDVQERMGVLLAHRASGQPAALHHVDTFLKDPDPEVRFLAAKWIADEKLTAFRPQLVEALNDRHLSIRLYFAYTTALARIDNQDVNEERMADYFVTRLTDPHSAPALRIAALRLVPPTHNRLTVDVLTNLMRGDDTALHLETVRMLNEYPNFRRRPLLLEVVRNQRFVEAVRAEALVGLATYAQDNLDLLLALARGDKPVLRDEALRALVGAKLSTAQQAILEEIAQRQPETADLAARTLGRPFTRDRPRPDDLNTWLKRLDGPADVAAGRRVFFHPRLASCSRCHRVDGRGQDIGPDLSSIGRTERRHILESILQPDNNVAPHYQVWVLVTKDGKVHTGMLMRTVLDEYTYADAQGALFKLNTRDIVDSRAVPKSIMPTGLVDLLTDQEMRDLLAYLCSRR